MLTSLAIIGTIATAIGAIATVITMRRTPKLPDPPYRPTVLHVEGVTMQSHVQDLPLSGLKARGRR